MANRRRPLLWLVLLMVPLAGGLWLVWSSGRQPTQIRRVARADEVLQAAAMEAQRRLPEFIARLEQAKEGERFAICGRFETSAGPEYLWVRDPILDGDAFDGILDQRPVAAKLEKGDAVRVRREDVFDWLIERDGRREGGFTLRVLGALPGEPEGEGS